jgi:uncharacterized OsmC-like protein
MDGADQIRIAMDRNVKAVTLRPSIAKGTAVTKVKLGPNLACEVEDGTWRFQVGMHEKYGGTNAGPNPGVYGRAALGSCLAIGYAMWAARLGIPIDSLEVLVQADYDVRGELGVSDEVTPGYSEVRYTVTVETSAPEDAVTHWLETADRTSSWRDVFARAVPVRGETRIRAGRSA